MSDPVMSPSSKKKKYILFSIVAIALGLLVCFFWLFYFRYYEYTNDAYVEGNKVVITPLIDGFVTAIHTDDTFLAKKGQLLVELDKTDALIAYNIAKEEYAKIIREISQAFHDVFIAKENIERTKAELLKAIQDYEHRLNVIDEAGVSIEEFEHAIAALRSTYHYLKMQIALFEKALSFVQGTSLHEHPSIKAAREKFIFAFVNLYRCNIYSPVDGLVAQRQIQVGMRINAGFYMMSVVPLDQIWVNANYKETQAGRMRLGQKVRVTSDLYGDDVVFDGVILGIPGAAGNAYSILPPQNLSGNWIKIVQRLPVRIGLQKDQLLKYPLRLGLSMETLVDLRNQGGQLVPDSSQVAPLYETNIFMKEEDGSEVVADEIFNQNKDESLMPYIYDILSVEQMVIDPAVDSLLSSLAPYDKF